jgi:hypothetical protein
MFLSAYRRVRLPATKHGRAPEPVNDLSSSCCSAEFHFNIFCIPLIDEALNQTPAMQKEHGESRFEP